MFPQAKDNVCMYMRRKSNSFKGVHKELERIGHVTIIYTESFLVVNAGAFFSY
jgi:hypothetical protein